MRVAINRHFSSIGQSVDLFFFRPHRHTLQKPARQEDGYLQVADRRRIRLVDAPWLRSPVEISRQSIKVPPTFAPLIRARQFYCLKCVPALAYGLPEKPDAYRKIPEIC